MQISLTPFPIDLLRITNEQHCLAIQISSPNKNQSSCQLLYFDLKNKFKNVK